MRTLLGVFHSGKRGLAARDQFEQAGYDVDFVDNAHPAADVTHEMSEGGGEGRTGSTATGAALGGIMGGGVGAVPGAFIGRAVGKWVSDKRSKEYQRDVANGGVLLIIRAEEVVPAAEAESMLYTLGADHVENGERTLS